MMNAIDITGEKPTSCRISAESMRVMLIFWRRTGSFSP